MSWFAKRNKVDKAENVMQKLLKLSTFFLLKLINGMVLVVKFLLYHGLVLGGENQIICSRHSVNYFEFLELFSEFDRSWINTMAQHHYE